MEQEIYSDDHLDLVCKSITRDGIVFECKNKTPRDIMSFFDIALDGKLQSMWSDADESTVASGETKACAEEMMISEEMLGYTIARLDEYAAEVVFDGGRCTIKYESYR